MTASGAPTPPGVTRWRGLDGGQRLWAQFDDDFFVYNPASGHTHLLNALAVRVLELLDESPCDERTLLDHLRAEVGDGEPGLAAALNAHLTQLHVIGLIEAAP